MVRFIDQFKFAKIKVHQMVSIQIESLNWSGGTFQLRAYRFDDFIFAYSASSSIKFH